jgi:dihydroneopterin aldolase
MKSVVGTLHINDYRVWAYHGWYEEERMLGAEYRIDVHCDVELPDSKVLLSDTVDYQQVVDIINIEMKKEHHLIETAASGIFNVIKQTFSTIRKLDVTVTKLNIPINNLSSTAFTISS